MTARAYTSGAEPTFAMVMAAMPHKRFDEITWSDAAGNDCPAIQGRLHVLYRDEPAGHWVVQGVIHYNDHSVGIFGAIEPGPVLSTGNAYDGIQDFLAREAEHEAQTVVERLGEALVEIEEQKQEQEFNARGARR